MTSRDAASPQYAMKRCGDLWAVCEDDGSGAPREVSRHPSLLAAGRAIRRRLQALNICDACERYVPTRYPHYQLPMGQRQVCAACKARLAGRTP